MRARADALAGAHVPGSGIGGDRVMWPESPLTAAMTACVLTAFTITLPSVSRRRALSNAASRGIGVVVAG
jgi:hypothetical protein